MKFLQFVALFVIALLTVELIPSGEIEKSRHAGEGRIRPELVRSRCAEAASSIRMSLGSSFIAYHTEPNTPVFEAFCHEPPCPNDILEEGVQFHGKFHLL